MNIQFNRFALAGTAAAAAIGFSAPAALAESIAIDGSSTVFPITEAVAEEFLGANPGAEVTVGVSGTGGGFSKFCAGETVISGASRPIKPEEMAACMEAGIEYIEIPVAYDAITVVINPENTWATEMTTEELATIWAPEAQGTVDSWNDVNSSWPDQPLVLYGPGSDSGTFDYFTDEIVGEEGASRGDYVASEDDNILVIGVQGDVNALGYFGYAYYAENEDTLTAVAVDGVAPSAATVNNGTYTPLSRPIFIYVRKDAMERPEVASFVEFYIDNAPTLVPEVGYVPLSEEAYSLALGLVENGVVGTVYQTNDTAGVDIEDVIEFSRTLEPQE
jgi:phosphate transport system substrate-binding protein